MGILIISITLFSVFLTGKRGILLFATAAVLITYFWFYSKADILGKILKLSVGAVAMLLIAYFIFRDVNIVNQVFVSLGRFSPFGHTSLNSFSNGRIGLWTLAWELFLQNPVFGAGWGAYYDLLTYDRHFDVHNVYLQLLCETGIVGFSVFMLFFIRTLVNTYQLLVREDQAVKKQHLSFSFCMQIFFLLYCFTGNPLYEHYTFIPYIIACAITYSAYYKSHLLVSPIRIDTEKGGDRVQGKEAEYMAAVITVHHVCNYGTQLQAFATQEKLKQYYDDVVFIDYRRRDTYGLGLMRIFTKGNPLKIPIILPTLVYWWYLFGGFRKKYLHLTKQVYLKDADFDSFDDCADVYFSGSDQIWNTGWNGGVIPAFYLSFAPEDKPKFAFASSFGKIRFTEDEITQSKKYIDRFCAISVREESGVSVLKEQYGYDNCLRIVDPTLCMPASFWRSVALPSKINDDYILIYNLYRSHMLDKYAAELSRRTGLKLYRFCTRFDHVLRNGKSLMMPKIFEFVTLIDNAKYVLTDSFHATAFSMNLNTEPICVYPDCYSGRISEFLDLLGEGQRHILSFEDFDVLERHVDFERVNMILDEERHRADKFLEQITSENIRRGKWNQ
ncbi:MAG: polysaccharide pyruvyl transferase family protein [Clostridiales Family XIII bacterium]|nr:polysaccharide pyruvyl transferase family protein [Clostridiales Family XIII bacterium]